ncbi:MAG TPA: potassium/proton antiporter, partial [Xanthobacteraceae bacterium]|nr:potassium/proton antiporter [Xanthobacteraceae bacterium]
TLTAPAAVYALGLGWTEALLVGAVVASTDAAAVFFLLHAKGLRLRPRVSATLEVESGINDPFAIFLTIVLIEMILHGSKPWYDIASFLAAETLVGALVGYVGARGVVLVLNRLNLPQGLHAPFVATGAVVIFALAEVGHGSGFLAVYVAGLVVGNSATRAHNAVVTFLDAATWLAQIGMFVVLGLLSWPDRLPQSLLPALAVAATLMLVARPVAVFLCLAPYPFNWREKTFMSWVGLRGAVGIFIAAIPMLVGVPNPHLYFDIGFVVVLVSLLVQGWTIAPAARALRVSFPRSDPLPRRVELDLPGQLEQEIVGYPLSANSPYLRRGVLPTWARPTLVVRDERILSPGEADPLRPGDYIYLLAPPERAQALDRFFVDLPPPARPDPMLLGDFSVTGEHTLGELADIYGLSIAVEETPMTLAEFIADRTVRSPKAGDIVPLGPIALVVQQVTEGRVATVGLRLAEELEPEVPPATRVERFKRAMRRLWTKLN